MPTLADNLRRTVTRFVDYGSEGASPARALMVRRARGFGLVAFGVLVTGLVVTLLSGLELTAYIAVFGIVVYGLGMHMISRDRGRHAPLIAHLLIGYLMASITVAAHHLGGANPASVTYPSLVILGCMYVLGIRAAAFWTTLALAALAGLTFTATLPPPPPGTLETGPVVIFVSRATVLVGVFAIAAMGRRFEDQATARLQHMARHDPLTGLCNRREMDRRLDEALARAERYEQRPALLFIDLDGFKQVNDQHGHAIGDEVLRGVADAIREQTRRTDAAGRIGGDEFVVLLEDAGEAKAAAAYAARLLGRVSATEALHVAPVAVRASLGVAVYPEDGRDSQSLTRAADAAMYAAKRQGGDRVTLARALARRVASA